jgi:hypothetical protein
MDKLNIFKSLDCLSWQDMLFVKETYEAMLLEVNDGTVYTSEEEFFKELLLRFKANKFLQVNPVETIGSLMRIPTYKQTENVIVPFEPNVVQKDIIRLIEDNERIVYPKYRCDGITSVLAAYIAVKSYLKRNTKTIFVAPNGSTRKFILERVGMFIDQLQKELAICPAKESLYKMRALEGITLYNGSRIKTFDGHDANVCRGFGDIDYFIIDECNLVKDEYQFRQHGELIVKDKGKFIETYTIEDKKRPQF